MYAAIVLGGRECGREKDVWKEDAACTPPTDVEVEPHPARIPNSAAFHSVRAFMFIMSASTLHDLLS